MNRLIAAITSAAPEIRDQSLDSLCSGAPLAALLADCAALEQFRRTQRQPVRARAGAVLPIRRSSVLIPAADRREQEGADSLPRLHQSAAAAISESIDTLLAEQAAHGPSASLSSALAAAYRALGFQTLADQVRRSVRSVRGNQWMFRDRPSRGLRAAAPSGIAAPPRRRATVSRAARSDAGPHGPDA